MPDFFYHPSPFPSPARGEGILQQNDLEKTVDSLPTFHSSSYCSFNFATTVGSARVVVSPSMRPSAMSRSRRFMILPLRVFGNRQERGFHLAEQWARSSSPHDHPSTRPIFTTALSETKAQITYRLNPGKIFARRDRHQYC